MNTANLLYGGSKLRAVAARSLTHGQRRSWSMVLLGLIVAVEFFENIVFVFSASHIMGGIDADQRSFAQVQSAYAIGSMLMIVKQQWLANRFGYRHYLTAALSVFIAGTLLAALSADLPQLTAARFIQGLGGGALFTSSRVLILIMFAPVHRPRAVRMFMLGIFMASAAAPAVAAEILDQGVWQEVFYAVLPAAIVATVGAWLLLPNVRAANAPRAPMMGPLLWFGASVVSLQAAMSDARFDLLSEPARPILVAVAGTALLAGFLRHQWGQQTPLIQIRALGNPVYLTGLALYFMYYLISYLSGYVFPIYAEQALGLPVTTVGWLNALGGAVSLVGILVYLRYARRVQRKKYLIAAGLLVMAVAAWRFSIMPPDAPSLALIPSLVMKGVFGIMVVIPIAGLTFRSLDDDKFPHGYQSKNLMRQIASSLAATLGSIALQNRWLSVHASLIDETGRNAVATRHWLEGVEAFLLAHGSSAGEAAHRALAELDAVVSHQSLLIATQDMYRMIALLALCGACVVLVQRRIFAN